MTRASKTLCWSLLVALALVAGTVWYVGRSPPPPPRARDAGAAPPPADAGAPDAGPPPVPAADLTFNPGWIGSACRSDGDCPYSGGFCLLDEEGFPRGTCSAPCSDRCPDRQGDLYISTVCVSDPSHAGGRGLCLAGCNLHLTPSGCRPGYICTSVVRRSDLSARLACEPDYGTPFPENDCTRGLSQRGLVWSHVQLADSLVRRTPGAPPPRTDICQIDTPVLLSSPVCGVDFRHRGERFADHLLVDCEMALALEKLARLLAERQVVEVEHNGTYVCRTVAGTGTLSGHGRARAIDIVAFTPPLGESLDIARWYADKGKNGRFLRQLTAAIRAAKIFDRVLTPDNSPTHQDHLHLEIK